MLSRTPNQYYEIDSRRSAVVSHSSSESAGCSLPQYKSDNSALSDFDRPHLIKEFDNFVGHIKNLVLEKEPKSADGAHSFCIILRYKNEPESENFPDDRGNPAILTLADIRSNFYDSAFERSSLINDAQIENNFARPFARMLDNLRDFLCELPNQSVCISVPNPSSFRKHEDGDGASKRTAGKLQTWRLRRAIDYVDAHLDGPIKLADLASAAGLSRMHFAAQFRAATGQRPCAYVTYRRIERAKHLLLSSPMSLAEIALTVGFQTQSHFTTVFKRAVGQTPHRWRCEQLAGDRDHLTDIAGAFLLKTSTQNHARTL